MHYFFKNIKLIILLFLLNDFYIAFCQVDSLNHYNKSEKTKWYIQVNQSSLIPFKTSGNKYYVTLFDFNPLLQNSSVEKLQAYPNFYNFSISSPYLVTIFRNINYEMKPEYTFYNWQYEGLYNLNYWDFTQCANCFHTFKGNIKNIMKEHRLNFNNSLNFKFNSFKGIGIQTGIEWVLSMYVHKEIKMTWDGFFDGEYKKIDSLLVIKNSIKIYSFLNYRAEFLYHLNKKIQLLMEHKYSLLICNDKTVLFTNKDALPFYQLNIGMRYKLK